MIGVDLEADSLFHYQEKVCLLQIARPEGHVLVDTLALKDLSPLKKIFGDKGIAKIFHGADYDIRSLYRDFRIEVNGLFDTQIAAGFLGLKETSLAGLLEARLHVHIDKKYQRKDWSIRPLPKAMVAYAAEDVSHLIPLARGLKKDLRKKGRLSWVEEECAALSRVRPASDKTGPLFLKFRGAGALPPEPLAALEALLTLRDRMARRRDLPPFKILHNRVLLEMAKRRPTRLRELKDIEGLSPKQIRALGPRLIQTIRASLEVPAEKRPVYPKRAKPFIGNKAMARVNTLKKWRERRAADLGLDPARLLTNTQIQAVAVSNPGTIKAMSEIPEIRSWQVKRFGREICERLKGTGRP
jgi:ribonuclease D